jgi:YggT family protein
LLFTVLDISILAEILTSYFPSLRQGNIYKILVSFNYPILEPFRRLQEKFFGNMMIDFSPILAIIFLNFLRRILIG